MKQNKKIAITGGIGSGKSAVSQILASKGWFVLDCDQITKQLYQKQATTDAISINFGSEFVVDGRVDTKKLGAYVFADQSRVQKLNQVMHPLIFAELDKQIVESGQKVVFVQIPLLFETGMQNEFDDVWLVVADEQTRISRVVVRDNLDVEQIKNRIKNQMDDEKKAQFVHTIIKNNGTLNQLEKAVDECIKRLSV
ncbi:MAG: dephospho-CoA kinase [Clostridia bacterium]|nr:dephospho-CoA kinase [Clostridia bacterium]